MTKTANPPILTQADMEAMAEMPKKGWFDPGGLLTRRPWYRCKRLEKAGVLEWRVVGRYPHLKSEYRRIPESHQDAND